MYATFTTTYRCISPSFRIFCTFLVIYRILRTSGLLICWHHIQLYHLLLEIGKLSHFLRNHTRSVCFFYITENKESKIIYNINMSTSENGLVFLKMDTSVKFLEWKSEKESSDVYVLCV